MFLGIFNFLSRCRCCVHRFLRSRIHRRSLRSVSKPVIEKLIDGINFVYFLLFTSVSESIGGTKTVTTRATTSSGLSWIRISCPRPSSRAGRHVLRTRTVPIGYTIPSHQCATWSWHPPSPLSQVVAKFAAMFPQGSESKFKKKIVLLLNWLRNFNYLIFSIQPNV